MNSKYDLIVCGGFFSGAAAGTAAAAALESGCGYRKAEKSVKEKRCIYLSVMMVTG